MIGYAICFIGGCMIGYGTKDLSYGNLVMVLAGAGVMVVGVLV